MGRSYSILAQRLLLDRRRLEDAHFQYAVLNIVLWYPSTFKLCDLPLHGGTQETLLQLSESYFEAFMQNYSGEKHAWGKFNLHVLCGCFILPYEGVITPVYNTLALAKAVHFLLQYSCVDTCMGCDWMFVVLLSQYLMCLIFAGHRCGVRGCGETIVIDGNMKNHRDVCLATEAGFVEYNGLSGRVTTGCANTPDFRSRYCHLHKPTSIGAQEEGKRLDAQVSGKQVGIILSKKSTRAQTFYQVHV